MCEGVAECVEPGEGVAVDVGCGSCEGGGECRGGVVEGALNSTGGVCLVVCAEPVSGREEEDVEVVRAPCAGVCAQ